MRRVISVIDPETNELVTPDEFAARRRSRSRCRTGSPTIIADFAPDRAFISPVDGSLITSRADREEHNRRNGVADVGNDPAYRNPKRPEKKPVDLSDTMREMMANPVACRRIAAEAGPAVDPAGADVGA